MPAASNLPSRCFHFHSAMFCFKPPQHQMLSFSLGPALLLCCFAWSESVNGNPDWSLLIFESINTFLTSDYLHWPLQTSLALDAFIFTRSCFTDRAEAGESILVNLCSSNQYILHSLGVAIDSLPGSAIRIHNAYKLTKTLFSLSHLFMEQLEG